MALGGFLRLAEKARDVEPRTPLQPALAAAYELGRGEARGGRTMDALLAAYRVGARVAWRELSSELVDERLARGYRRGVRRARLRLHRRAVGGERRRSHRRARDDGPGARALPRAARAAAAGGRLRRRAGRRRRTRRLGSAPDADRRPPAGAPGPPGARGARRADRSGCRATSRGRTTPRSCSCRTPAGPRRARLLRALEGRDAVVGPVRPWTAVASSVHRARRARELIAARGRDAVDTEAHLAPLLIQADAEALADLRRRALEPLSGLRPSAGERLAADAPLVAAAPGPSRRRRGRPHRAPADRPLPDDAAARALRRPPARSRSGPRARDRPGRAAACAVTEVRSVRSAAGRRGGRLRRRTRR